MTYLNYNSTSFLGGVLNPSDIGYDIVKENQLELNALVKKIKIMVNAPPDAKCIFTSGATEGIATFMHWALTPTSSNGGGLIDDLTQMYAGSGNREIVGTVFDHPAIIDNALNYGGTYSHMSESNIKKAAGVVFTQVNGKTGEYIQVRNIYSKISGTIPGLVLLDATQSIGKIPVNMQEARADAVIFSFHKINGPMNLGCMIISERKRKFIPLIAGEQQDKLRGGTLNLFALNGFEFEEIPRLSEKRWNEVFDKFVKAGLDVYKPRTIHLHDTFLISCEGCPIERVNKLSKQGIYIGTATACEQGNDGKIRITARHDDELNNKTVDAIIKALS